MRVLLVGGGTVGHISPAIAIAEEIRSRDKDCEFLFVGREGGEENKEVKKHGIPLSLIRIRGLKRSLSAENIKTALMLIQAKKEAKKILLDFCPDVVIGTGGYVCYPIISVAKKLNIPTVIHESNSTLGVTARILSPKCDKVFLGFGEAMDTLKTKSNVTISGTPVRREFYEARKEASRQRLGIPKNDIFILSFGGSGGSKALNNTIIDTMKEYCAKEKGILHVHATGRKYFEAEKERLYKLLPKRCIVKPYIENMPIMLSAADIVISRSGAMSIAELSATSKASILIPSPNVTDNHQYKNARVLSDKNAAVLLEEKDLTTQTLIEKINYLRSHEKRRIIEKNISLMQRRDCAKSIVDDIYHLIQGRK